MCVSGMVALALVELVRRVTGREGEVRVVVELEVLIDSCFL
jgi:hypothetical protein